MGIYEKLEEIRQKPERTRVIYAGVLTAFSLIIVLIVWFSSIQAENFQSEKIISPKGEKLLKSLSEEGNAVKDSANEIKNILEVQNP